VEGGRGVEGEVRGWLEEREGQRGELLIIQMGNVWTDSPQINVCRLDGSGFREPWRLMGNGTSNVGCAPI
jgi:hypothetical protein